MVIQDTVTTEAKLSESGWTIECGHTNCGAVLADVAWVDVDYNMAVNASEFTSSPLRLDGLLPPHRRRYRLAVMLPFEWLHDKALDAWIQAGVASRGHASFASPASRVVRGKWSEVELGRPGIPPFQIVCTACGGLLRVPPQRRQGTPSPSLLPRQTPWAVLCERPVSGSDRRHSGLAGS